MIRLYKNNAYQWFEKDHVYTIGYAFYQNKLYEDVSLVELIVNLKDTIKEKIKEMTGYFAIVIEKENGIILISDIIRSFPLFYNTNGDVTDDITLLKGKLDELSIQELLSSRWVSNDDTIYQEVKQIENAQIVEIQDGNIRKKKYFNYEYNIKEDYSLEELDQVFRRMIEKTICYLNGRTAIVPLSGGNDSRLLLYYLKLYQYPKIITYTYGRRGNRESEISKRVAEFLGVPWYFVEYTKKSCRKEYENKTTYAKMADYFGRGYSIPHIQEWEAIKQLIDNNKINQENVVLPGFTLDFLAGNHVDKIYLNDKKVYFDKVKEDIYSKNYNLIKKFDNTIFDKKLKTKFNLETTNCLLDVEKAANLYEKYDFEERQAKFITNAVRTYDYYGLKWYLPFWEKELILFWSKVSLKDKYSRKFFKDFTQYKYKELMEYAPTYEKKKKNKKMNLFQKIYQIYYIYSHNPLNFYYYFKFSKYLKYAIIEKNFAYDYYVAKDYIKYLRRNKKMEYRICKRCVMDTSDPTIQFDENGFCNHCRDAIKNKPATLNEKNHESFHKMIDMLKEEGKNKKYDCILGISGGIDSSYLAYLLSKEGLRILGIHIDAGWDTEVSSRNLEKLCKICKIDMKTIKIKEEEMMDLQRAYFFAQVINQDVPQDHAFFAELYQYMIKEKQKYFISGHNWATESITPLAWGFDAYDSTNIKDIHKKYGKIKLKEYPFISFYENRIKIPYICKIKKLRPLNCIDYNPNEALKILEKEVGFEYYGSKHNESVFTRLLQTYIQPKKYGFEKRRAHLSSEIVSGLITREEALKILEKPAEKQEQIEKDIAVVIQKMKISREEFDKIVNSKEIIDHLKFKNDRKKEENFQKLKKILKKDELKCKK